MSTRPMSVAVAATAACALIALPSVVGAARSGAARSGVTIQTGRFESHGRFDGKVFSQEPEQCANHRTVKLFKQKGNEQNPARDRAVSKTQSYRNHGGTYRWFDGYASRPGDFYARVPATPACKPDNSKTIHLAVRPSTTITGLDYGNGVAIDFRGHGGVPGYRYHCKRDHQQYRHCPGTSKFYGHLNPGHHVFRVFAIGANGKRDRTPAKRGFSVPHR